MGLKIHELIQKHEVHLEASKCEHCCGSGVRFGEIKEGFIRVSNEAIADFKRAINARGYALEKIQPIDLYAFNCNEAWYEIVKRIQPDHTPLFNQGTRSPG